MTKDIITPKEKAKELIETFRSSVHVYHHYHSNCMENRKRLAKYCIKEIVTELNKLPSKDLSDLQFWGEVEYEINKYKTND
jgi:hypothetical protein